MAQSITRLLPNHNVDGKDVINEFSLDAASGEAGTFVKIVASDLTKGSNEYVNSSYFTNSLGNATSQYPENPRKVGVASGTGDGGAIFGMLLRDVRDTDENGEKLHFYPQKKEELQCVLSGESVPIATAGIIDLNVRGLAGGISPSVGDYAVLSANGQVSGVAFASLSTEQKDASVGKFIGTGIRVSQQSTDAFAGPYARLKFSL